ncbi:MAG: thioredoxin-disulfide reductase [Candidatus Micrarchaeota archaeon]
MYDVIIIGAGPAGSSAAIYAVRKNMKTLVLEGKMVGGEIALSHNMANYLGFTSISGMDFAQRMEEHLKSLNVEIKYEEATELKRARAGFSVSTASGNKYESKTVILATGARYKRLNIPGEKELLGKGVSYCSTCDGPFFKDKVVAVIGGGNTAVSSALLLASFAKKVYTVHRRDEFRADEIMVKELMKKTECVCNHVPLEIIGKESVTGLRVQEVNTKKERVLEVQGVFVHVGAVPSTELAKQAGVEMDERGYIKTDRHQRTSVPGFFAAGDIAGVAWQVAAAVGQGAVAAISAYDYLKKKG